MLRRELLRLSRRAQTWAVRTGYSAVLLGFGLLVLRQQLRVFHGPSELGRIGYQLFQFYAGTQLAAVCLLAPLMVASGVQEERDANTLDLLALTGVGAGRILFDQIASRLASLMVVILAAAPFLAVVNTFGGFGTAQAVNALYGALLVAVILGNFAGFTSLITRSGPLVPLVLCLPYGMVLFGMPALLMGGLGSVDPGWASPMAAVFSDEPWAVACILFWLPALVSGWGLAVPVFRIVTAGDEADDEFGLLSPDIWAIERFKRNTWAWAFGAVCALGVATTLHRLLFRDRTVRFVLASLLALLVIFAAHRVAMVVVLEGTRWLSSVTTAATAHRGFRSVDPRPIWRWAVTWRETMAGGSIRTRLWIAAGLFWAFVALVWLFSRSPGPDEHGVLASTATLAAALGSAVVMVSTVLDEKRRRSLPLLWLTRLDPLTVARQKTAAVVGLTLPLTLPAALVLGASPVRSAWYPHGEHPHPLGEPLLAGMPLLPTLTWTVYGLLLVGNIALCAGIVAAWLRNPRAAWPLALLAGFLFLAWPFPVLLTLEVLEFRRSVRDLEDVLIAWYPLAWDFYGPSCNAGGISRAALLGAATQFALMPLLWRLYAWRLSRC